MQAGRQARALAIGLSLCGPAPATAQNVIAATGPAPQPELRAASETLETQGDLLGAAALLETALGARRRTPSSTGASRAT